MIKSAQPESNSIHSKNVVSSKQTSTINSSDSPLCKNDSPVSFQNAPTFGKDLDSLINLTDISQIEEAINWLSIEEAKLDNHLDKILATKKNLDADFLNFLTTLPIIEDTQSNLIAIRKSIDDGYSTVEPLHNNINLLNNNKIKIEEASDLVDKGILFLENISKVENSINSGEIEAGCQILSECIQILDILDSSKSTLPQETKDIIDLILQQISISLNSTSAATTLEKNRNELTRLVALKFDKSSSNNDNKAIIECFKLFPLLNEKGLGLEKYSKLLCQKLSDNYKLLKVQSDKEGAFLLRLVNLFDSVAYLIDSNTSLVEKYYGEGSMTRVIQHLQLELDSRVVLVLESFEDERQISKLKYQIQFSKEQLEADLSNVSIASTVDQSSKTPGNSGKRPNAPKNNLQNSSKSASVLQDSQFETINENVDAIAISKLVPELAMMAAKGESFLEFLSVKGQSGSDFLKSPNFESESILLSDTILLNSQRKSSILSKDIYASDGLAVPKLSVDSNTGLLIGTQLEYLVKWIQSSYLEFEIYSMQRAVLRALQLDDINVLEGWNHPIFGDLGNNQNGNAKSSYFFNLKSKKTQFSSISLTSSITGDIFYVLQTALHRCLNTQNASLFNKLSISACDILKRSYLTYIDHFIQHGWVYPSSAQQQSSLLPDQGAFKSARSSGEYGSRMSRDGANSNMSSSSSNLTGLGALGLSSSDWKQSFKNSITNSSFVSVLGLNNPGDNVVVEQQKRVCVGLNNLDVSINYLEALCDGLSNRFKQVWELDSFDDIPQDDPLYEEIDSIKMSIRLISDVKSSFNGNLIQGLTNLGNQALKLKIRQALKDSYRDIKYVLSNEEEFTDLMNEPLFVSRLFILLDQPLFSMFKNRLTIRNFGELIGNIGLGFLIYDWQRAILQSKFNYLGGLVFERDVKLVLSKFEDLLEPVMANSNMNLDVRSKFSKLIQMASIMASEQNQLDEFSNQSQNPSLDNTASANSFNENSSLYRRTSLKNKLDSTLINSGFGDISLKLDSLSILSQNEIAQLSSNRIQL
ncbi:Conserved oligomeric Golgi complex subunit 4 [Smittium culicis]|uniref:Conserved oligomeric Golgi complex subunit 4 n=1 Tax=Smittium culicis TaxID=133412 RepID=A0A1R1Y5I6_9FUNG|nr:Conserved oligomeric Golgi complex subunit 4 [Smittium culicis]